MEMGSDIDTDKDTDLDMEVDTDADIRHGDGHCNVPAAFSVATS